jgi:uncharacterized protein (TIGR00730 family)
MKRIADAVRAGGRQIIGISTEQFKLQARSDADEMIMTRTLGERKQTMLDRCDAIVVLVGGLGTVDELTEMIELKRQGDHDKPIIVVNTEGFYDGLNMQLRTMAREGLLPTTERPGIRVITLSELVSFVETPAEAMAIIDTIDTAERTTSVLSGASVV